MKKVIVCLLISVFLSNLCITNVSADRPKVAVVLSGGGAMGAAHASVLKVIEEAGIPVDMVVGTSMGAIIGGLYAYGYSPAQLDSILRSEDWKSLLTNSTHRENMDFSSRTFDDKYIITVPLFRDKSEHLYGGVLSGEAVLNLFKTLTPNCQDSINFKKLQIPFACVAFDVMANEEVDMYDGVLYECIRSSMSIPGLFSPMRKDGMVLVDGGVANNFPVDIAKNMGADVVIGVTLDPAQEDLTPESVSSTMAVIGRLLDKAKKNKTEDNLENTDLVINVDTRGYNSGSFTNEAIADLLDRGEMAARAALPEMIELRDSLGLKDTVSRRTPIEVPQSAQYVTGAAKEDYGLKVGGSVRIDDEEMASVLMGANYKVNTKLFPVFDAQIRIGQRSYCYLSGTIKPFDKWSVMGTYRFYYNESKLYQNGDRVLDWNFHEHFVRLSMFRTWNNIKLTIGASLGKKKFDDLLSSSTAKFEGVDLDEDVSDTEKNINYYTSFRLDTRDARMYPHQGALGVFRCYYETDNGAKYDGDAGLPIAEFYYEKFIPLSERLTFVPGLWGRFIFDSDWCRLSDRNMIGGVGTLGHYMPQQVPFAGVNHFEVIDNKLAALDATMRYRLGKNHNFSAILNYGWSSQKFKDFLTKQQLVGCALGYGYKTPVGPLDFNLNWSNVTKNVGCWISFGYMF